MKSSDRTARTLTSSDRIARLPCGPKSWYLHHLDTAAAAPVHIAHSKDQLDVNYVVLAVYERS